MGSSCALQSAGVPTMTFGAMDDEHLMTLLQDGEEEALAALVERYQHDVFRFCLHYLKNVEAAREGAQETFLRVYVARDRFDTGRRFKPWMLCIARNLCLNELKRKRAVPMETLETYASTAREESGAVTRSPEDGPAERAMAGERAQTLEQALDSLPEEAREIVVLRYFEKMSARQIAEIVESTEGAVRTRLHRILKQLRSQYAPMKEDL